VFEVQEKGTPKNTVRAYTGDWKAFTAWCRAWEREPLCGDSPEEHEQTLVLYLTYMVDEGYKATTIDRALTGIVAQHKGQGRRNPRSALVADHMAKIRRVIGVELDQAAPLLVSDLEKVSAAMKAHPGKVTDRDRAALLIGWAGALRRSELAALDRRDMQVRKLGLIVRLRGSKTDQERRGLDLSLPRAKNAELCPVLAYERWLEVRAPLSIDGSEHLFCRSHRSLLLMEERIPEWQFEKIIARWVRLAKLEPEDPELGFSPHSLRAGFITEAVRAGRVGESVMGHSRHRSHKVFMGYVRRAVPFEHHPGEGLL